ncbi:MAG: ABC transporter permease [Bacteroidales bacterium]
MANLRLAFRTLFKTPFVTVVAIASLGLGIGANAGIFSLFNELLLQPLPVHRPTELVNLGAPGPKPGSQSCNQAGDCEQVFSYAMFRDLERVQRAFTGIAAHRLFGVNLAYKGQTTSGQGLMVSGSYFPVLGIRPALGRLLGPSDDPVIGQSPVVVLSHEYWRTRFGADPGVLDQPLIVNGRAYTIVGVAPEGFRSTTLGAAPRIFAPMTMRSELEPGFKDFGDRRDYWAYLFARLKPGVTLEQARVSLDVAYHAIVNDVEASLQKEMSAQTLRRFRAKQVIVEDGAHGQSNIRKGAKEPMTLLLGVTAFVLLIACANIANLLLARAATRAAEMAVRLSIGGSRWQLVRQLLTESMLLALCGGIAGVFVARWTLDLILSILPAEATTDFNFGLNPTVLLFTAGLTLATGLLFGLFPALHGTRPDLASILKGQSGQPGGARKAARFRTALAVVQIALSMMLLVSAGLFTKSLVKVSHIDLGLRVDDVVTFSISPQLNGYDQPRALALYERLEDDLAALPGVTGVANSLVPLLADSSWGNDVTVEGFQAGPDTDVNSRFNAVGTGYFRTLGIPILVGREFTRADAAGAQKVAIVNQQFAKKFNLGRNPVGKRMSHGGDKSMDVEIVGLVKDSKYNQVKDPVPPLFFRPYRQRTRTGFLTFYARTALDPALLLPTIRKVVAQRDPNLPVDELRTMKQQVRENIFLDRFITTLSSAFALLATLLAAVGLYGVLAYTVTQRTREIGLRMALGAAPRRVQRMVLKQVAWMTTGGCVIGLAAALGLGRAAQSLLFELKGHDPAVLAGAILALSVVALGAGFIPAYRASRIDPLRALRYE